MPILTVGRQGGDVQKLQESMVKLELLSNEDIDGYFGSETERAVKRFQASTGLVADGIVGDRTWQKIAETPKLPVPEAGLVTSSQIEYIFGKPISPYLFNDLNKCLERFEINKPERIRQFIAQIAHESVGFQFFVEFADGSDYEPPSILALQLGNTEPGDGARFKGAGALQMTGRYNYQRFADYMGDARIMEGVEYVASTYPITSAGFWWYDNKMNFFVDSGATCEEVSRKVNGGTNGLSDRLRYYNLALDVITG